MALPFDTIAKLRRRAVDEASGVLAAHLEREELAEMAIGVAEAALAQERDAALSLAADDLAVEAFAAWLPQGRQALETARAARDRAEAATAQARACLAATRAAAEAVQARIGQLAAEDRIRLLRAEQTELDEAAGRHVARTTA